MPTLYHGTRLSSATAMAGTPGTIDVNRGGGEFGRGFYTQKSKANALSWVLNRCSNSDPGALLELSIDDSAYLALDIRLLDLKDARRLTQSIRSRSQSNSYLRGCDVVVGPLNLHPRREQQKFESSDAQDVLNGPQTTRTVI